MKITWGALVTDGSGKLGGHVASKNRGGSYLRTKVKPANAQTTAQMASRNALATYAQNWRGLTESQRLSFNNAVGNFPVVKNGKTHFMSGEQLYVKLNKLIELVGGTPITTAPLPAAIPAFTLDSATVDISDTEAELTFSAAAVPMGYSLVVEATAPYSPGKYNVNNLFRFIGTATPAMNVADVWALYIAKFGTPTAGQKVSFRCKLVGTDTGLEGLFTTAVATVSA